MNALKKCSQLGCRPKLGNGLQFLEGRGERARQAPHGSRCELLVLRIEVVIVHDSSQVLGYLKFSLDERSIDDQLRALIGKARPFPCFDLLPHWLEVPLHAVHADGEDVDEA